MNSRKSLDLDSALRQSSGVPFANEMDVQRFVENHAKAILGLDVIASAQRNGHRLFGADIVAVDGSNSPFIIECKWDLIDAKAVEQLARYQAALLAGWCRFEASVSKVRGVPIRVAKSNPVLVTIGYRYDAVLLTGGHQTRFLVYAYQNGTFTDDEFQEQAAGRVRLRFATDADTVTGRHPKVSKRLGTDRSLQRCAPELRATFWALDDSLRKRDAVSVSYGKIIKYRGPTGPFATATIGDGFIRWTVDSPKSPRSQNLGQTVDLRAVSDAAKVLAALQRGCR